MNIIDLATKAMQTAIKSVVDAINTVVDTINTRIGSQTSTASKTTSANAHAKLNYLTANMPIGTIKSVQRGTFTSSGSSINIPISTVNPSKCFLLIDGGASSASAASAGWLLRSLTANELIVERTNSNDGKWCWQLIETY